MFKLVITENNMKTKLGKVSYAFKKIVRKWNILCKDQTPDMTKIVIDKVFQVQNGNRYIYYIYTYIIYIIYIHRLAILYIYRLALYIVSMMVEECHSIEQQI